jgi:hypothetical protein
MFSNGINFTSFCFPQLRGHRPPSFFCPVLEIQAWPTRTSDHLNITISPLLLCHSLFQLLTHIFHTCPGNKWWTVVVLGVEGFKWLQITCGLKIWGDRGNFRQLNDCHKRQFWRYEAFFARIWNRLSPQASWEKMTCMVKKCSSSSAE